MFPKAEFDKKSKFHFVKFWKTSSSMQVNVHVERFHLNSLSIGLCPQTQKLDLPYKTPLFTLAVGKG